MGRRGSIRTKAFVPAQVCPTTLTSHPLHALSASFHRSPAPLSRPSASPRRLASIRESTRARAFLNVAEVCVALDSEQRVKVLARQRLRDQHERDERGRHEPHPPLQQSSTHTRGRES